MQRALSSVLSVGMLAVAFSATANPAYPELTIENKDPGGRTLWVTVIIPQYMGRDKSIAFCLPPRDSRSIHLDLKSGIGRFELMGELTRNVDCQQPVDCKATQTVEPAKWMVGSASKPQYTFRANAQTCSFRAEPR